MQPANFRRHSIKRHLYLHEKEVGITQEKAASLVIFFFKEGVKLRGFSLTFTAARHISATIRPATLVSNIFETAKLKTFSKATYR